MRILNSRVKILCKTCLQEKRTSIVVPRETKPDGLFKPVVQYYDGEGNPHGHDPNVVVTRYVCDRDHEFTVRYGAGCPSCPWTAEPLDTNV